MTAEVKIERVKRTMYWAGGIMGSADSQYPHPDQWTIDMTPGRRPLDKIGVREITIALRKPKKLR